MNKNEFNQFKYELNNLFEQKDSNYEVFNYLNKQMSECRSKQMIEYCFECSKCQSCQFMQSVGDANLKNDNINSKIALLVRFNKTSILDLMEKSLNQ